MMQVIPLEQETVDEVLGSLDWHREHCYAEAEPQYLLRRAELKRRLEAGARAEAIVAQMRGILWDPKP